MIRRPPRSTRVRSSAASDVYKRQPTVPCCVIGQYRILVYLHIASLCCVQLTGIGGIMPKHRIVIIGGSFGGVNTAYRLRRELGEGAKITVISAEPHFTFIPSLPWVTMGWREPDRLRVPLG